MEEKVLIKVPEAAKIANVSEVQAYRLVRNEWRKAGIVVAVGSRTVRINRKGLLAWAGEKVAA